MKVYLAGPILGCDFNQAVVWRYYAKLMLGDSNCLDPMRRDYRGVEEQFAAEIVTSDLEDIDNSDVVLANCWTNSVGTSMEIFYAHSKGKRVIAVVSPDKPVSPWLSYHADIFGTLYLALSAVRTMMYGG